jgi:hypothetical protein
MSSVSNLHLRQSSPCDGEGDDKLTRIGGAGAAGSKSG